MKVLRGVTCAVASSARVPSNELVKVPVSINLGQCCRSVLLSISSQEEANELLFEHDNSH